MVGQVTHRRLAPMAHGFRYRLAMYRLDLDELDTLDARLRLFGVDRARPVSFHRADHLTDVRARLLADGVTDRVERIELLANCRIFGYVFNPVSFFFCYSAGERLAAIVCEVNNTFGESHAYVLKAQQRPDWREKKVFHVSPFFTLDGTYRFRFEVTADHVAARIDLYRAGKPHFLSRLSLDRRPLTDRAVAGALTRYPFVTAKIVVAIHWQALRLWWKGARVHRKPAYDPETARRTTES
jgi:DUF1365 family protein